MASGFGCAVVVAIAFLIQMVVLAKEKVYYADLERFNVTYWNPKYFRNVSASCRRYSRKDPVHYCNIHLDLLVPAGNNILLDYYVYEFLSNEYRRSFVEVHFKLCDVLYNDPYFSPLVKELLGKAMPKDCPLPKMTYHLENISIVGVPMLRNFPFQKGRVFLNVTDRFTANLEHLFSFYVDAVIKQMWR